MATSWNQSKRSRSWVTPRSRVTSGNVSRPLAAQLRLLSEARSAPRPGERQGRPRSRPGRRLRRAPATRQVTAHPNKPQEITAIFNQSRRVCDSWLIRGEADVEPFQFLLAPGLRVLTAIILTIDRVFPGGSSAVSEQKKYFLLPVRSSPRSRLGDSLPASWRSTAPARSLQPFSWSRPPPAGSSRI